MISLVNDMFELSETFSQLYVGWCKCTVLCMGIPIFICIETCYDKFDIMITPSTNLSWHYNRAVALVFIIGRYINYTYYYCY